MPEIPLKNNAVREISKENDLTMLSLQKIKFYDFMNIYILSYCNYHLLYSKEIKRKKKNNDQY